MEYNLYTLRITNRVLDYNTCVVTKDPKGEANLNDVLKHVGCGVENSKVMILNRIPISRKEYEGFVEGINKPSRED